ncbi:MAG: HAMP domain-containing histidine kinase [Verrucomicrobiales bacterium]|nr:HAMP domain-containing histidine kinase [Verrucomicrobiales bacterium]
MFSKLFPDHTSSTWRLVVLQAITIGTSIALCLTLAGWALHRDLDEMGRKVVLDDLGEHAVFYEQEGIAGVQRLFASGQHNDDDVLRLVSADGKVLFDHHPTAAGNFHWPDSSHLRKLANVKGLVTIEHPENDEHILIGRVVLNDGAILWYGRMDAADREYLGHIRDYLWIAGIAAAVIALIPVFWYGGQVLRPVRSMIASAQKLARGTGDSRLEAPSAVPELREFAAAFNKVLDRNANLTLELQAANDHLAHELRTPLARIRGNLEAFQDHAGDDAGREAAARGIDEIDRATSLVQTILNVRAGEHNALMLHRERTSLRTLLESIIDLYMPSAEERQQNLHLEAETDSIMEVDTQRLVQAITNLLDNALGCTPKGGDIIVRLETTPDVTTISVLDSGPGIAKEEMEQIWERFVRGSAAAHSSGPGMGLGLSLVRAVATAHGGKTGCRNRDTGGAEFWIQLRG